MSSQTDICNFALVRIGVQQQLVNINTDANLVSLTCLLVWPEERDFVLRDFPWPWATKYVALAAGTANPNPDWLWSYPYPSDAVFIRRIATATGRLEPNSPAFRIGNDGNGNRVIFTDTPASSILTGVASFEYTMQVTDPTQFDAVFVSMLAWRIGSRLALGIARLADLAKVCLEEYNKEKQEAENTAVLEGQKDAPVDLTDPAAIEIVTLALLRIGVTSDLEPAADRDLVAEARLAKIAFVRECNFLLRDFPWPWATAFATPPLLSGAANGDWPFAYACPIDAVLVRRIVDPITSGCGGGAFLSRHRRHRPLEFAISSDAAGGRIIFAKMPNITIEYTRQLTSPAEFDFYDPIFSSMLAHLLGRDLAPSRIKDPKLAEARGQAAYGKYLMEKSQAQAQSLNEGQEDEPPEAEWIRARGR